MTPDELRKLITDAGLGDKTSSEVARVIGCSRSHLYRWLKGDTKINPATALLVRSKLRPKRRKK